MLAACKWGLDRRWPATVPDQPGVEVGIVCAKGAEFVRCIVVTGQADERCRRAIGNKIRRDIAGAAEARAGRAVFQDRDRRLR